MLSGLTMRSGASRFPRSPSVVSCSPNLYNIAYTQQQIEPKVTKNTIPTYQVSDRAQKVYNIEQLRNGQLRNTEHVLNSPKFLQPLIR